MLDWTAVIAFGLPGVVGFGLALGLGRTFGLRSLLPQFAIVAVLVATLSAPMHSLVEDYLLPPVRAWQAVAAAEEAVAQDPDFAVLLREHPDRRDWFATTVLRTSLDDVGAANALAEIVDWERSLIGAYVGRTSDSAVQEFATELLSLVHMLAVQEPTACKSIVEGASVSAALPHLGQMGKQTMERLMRSMARVVKDAVNDPQPARSAAWVRETIAEIRRKAAPGGAADLRDPLDPTLAPRSDCHALIAIYKLAYEQLPERDLHALLRGGLALYFADPSI